MCIRDSLRHARAVALACHVHDFLPQAWKLANRKELDMDVGGALSADPADPLAADDYHGDQVRGVQRVG
eukprot:8870353-Alexandrium_andersonii.AAC.1